MRSKRHWRTPQSRRRGSLTIGEFIDPRDERVSARPHRENRKVLQLCRQVADTLAQVLSGECDDDVLRSLQVVTVVPAPDASQLLVIVAPALADDRLDPADVLQRLAAFSGRLRYEVAAAITRKRAPRLAYQFVSGPPGGAAPLPP
jgi:ribosome-binding factor A